MTDYNTVPAPERIGAAQTALTNNGFRVTVVENQAAAKRAVLGLIPKGAEVFTTTSRTLEDTGLAAALNDSGEYDAVRPKLIKLMGDPAKKREQRALGGVPEYVIGSVHALTEDGHVLIASNTGSQLPAYAYGAEHVVWVVGAQKIVKDLDEAWKRLTEHTFPLENVRAQQAYGADSHINRVLTYMAEPAGRIDIIVITEAVGF